MNSSNRLFTQGPISRSISHGMFLNAGAGETCTFFSLLEIHVMASWVF